MYACICYSNIACVSIHIYVYMYMCILTYIYIYIGREREREKNKTRDVYSGSPVRGSAGGLAAAGSWRGDPPNEVRGGSATSPSVRIP